MISLPILLARLQFWSMEIIRLRRTQDGYDSGDRWRDEAMRRVISGYGPGWRSKIAIRGAMQGQINHFHLVAQSPGGEMHDVRMPLPEYLQIVAATSFKQRTRKMIEYFHADRLNYAVVGTPNRLEYDQGFFVKGGDGAADLKPIAHLYKTQVYQLAHYLGVPASITSRPPTTDTFSLPQSHRKFNTYRQRSQLQSRLFMSAPVNSRFPRLSP